MRQPAPVALATLLALCAAARAADAPTSFTVKPHTDLTFSIATGQKGASYGLTRVQKDGKELPAPPNMMLDRQNGAFAWKPTESQSGGYAISFLIRNADGTTARAERSITVTHPPIVPAKDKSEVAKLLRAWFREGTAAGNTGDFYDNRDGAHSPLAMGKFPQLDRVVYTEDMKKRRLNWALQVHFLYNHVTMGNSSTASGNMSWGSNPRHALLSPQAVQALYRQYTHSHIYIYPEHRDHDPGHNGRGGYGDVFPANTPYVIVSQGSSGSDRPFMEAVVYTLAAFRPDAKKLLTDSGLLMPTVQMVFRSANRNIEKPEDYLTGKAHPTVFKGGNVDVVKMAQLAHAIERKSVPPMVQLEVLDEDVALLGRDYFETAERERLLDTPCAIARIVRSTKHTRRMVVSAAASYDMNRRPLTYRWVVLRGDAERIRIKPLADDGSKVELLVPFHERRPVLPGSAMESTRVDIGCFVHNGVHHSAPGFVSLYSLDTEARTYAPDGRILEMYYANSDPTIGAAHSNLLAREAGYDITDWPKLLAVLAPASKGFAADLLRKPFNEKELADFQKAAVELSEACEGEQAPQAKHDEADAARKKAGEEVKAAKKALDDAKKAHAATPTDAAKAAVDAAEKALKDLQAKQKAADKVWLDHRRTLQEAQGAARKVLTASRPALGGSVKDRIEAALNALRADADLYFANAAALGTLGDDAAKKALQGALNTLAGEGVLKDEGGGKLALTPAVAGPKPARDRITKFERLRIQWLNITVLQKLLYPGMLNLKQRRNFSNPLLATPKAWRDIYHYDAKGRLVGWTRCEGKARRAFTADGALVLEKDAQARPVKARTVIYTAEGDRRNVRPLKEKPGDTIRHYEYAGDDDRVGRIAGTEKAPADAKGR